MAILLLSLASICASAYGIDPVRDSLYKQEFRVKMDSIRAHRPVVALVLSGGGAKGCAHIGAIRRLEEIGIPVDMVLGTSMGGLVGGMYSLGYSPDEMEKTVCNADWDFLITDKMPREYKSLEELKYRSQHQISIPFYYPMEFFREKKEKAYKEEGRPKEYAPMSIGAERDSKKALKDNIWESLPESYVPGQNVTNLINSIAVGYIDTTDFVNMPIPFCCTASDMVSFQAKRWYEGKLATALRSTMSIPILFASVRTDGMVLVDGGMRDNYPVALARELGADIVIGVELSNAKINYSDVNNVGDIISQGIDMLGADSFRSNENAADIKIKPDLHEYNMLSFDDEAIPIIIQRGYEAAQSEDSLLLDLKAKVGSDVQTYQAPKAVNLSEQSVRINEVVIQGVTKQEESWLMKNVGLIPGGLVNKAKLDKIVGQVFATQTFTSVTYELLGTKEPYTLVLHCRKGPIHQFGLGLRFDTEEVMTANVNIGLNTRRLQGFRCNLDGKVSANPVAGILLSYDSPVTPTFNLEAKGSYSNLGRSNLGDDTETFSSYRANLNAWKLKTDFFISNIKWKQVDAKAGVRWEAFTIGNLDSTRYQTRGGAPMYDLGATRNGWLTTYIDASQETFDSYYFPSTGMSLGIYYGWTFARTGNRPGSSTDKFHNFHTLAVNGRFVIPCASFFRIIPSFSLRAVISPYDIKNRKDDSFTTTVPLPFLNLAGGTIQGRYFDQQVTFEGLNYATAMDDKMGIVRADFQFQIGKNNYITAKTNYAHDCHYLTTFGQGNNYFGAGLEYAYNTIAGPIAVDVHWGCKNGKALTSMPGVYVSVGYNF